MPSFGDWGTVRYPRFAAAASRAVCLFLGVTIHWGAMHCGAASNAWDVVML
ncbi:MAG: hypothetical protein ACI85K_000381 [Hyphomicrobiaceae bacterium]|jgi:hypothetical protein